MNCLHKVSVFWSSLCWWPTKLITSLRGRHLKGKGKGVLTPFPFPFKCLPRRLTNNLKNNSHSPLCRNNIFFSLWSLNNQWHPILHLEVITSRSQQWKLLILITKSKLQAIIPVGFLFQVLDTKWCHLYYSKGSMKSPWLPSLWCHQSLGWQTSELQLSFQDLPLSTEIYHEQKVSTIWLLSNEPSKVRCQPGRLMLSWH